MSIKSIDDLFLHGVKDLFYAEKKLVQTLPKMAKKANSAELKQAIEQHLAETQDQVERLERIFELLDETPRGKKCPAMDGLIAEGKEIMEEAEDDDVLDAGMLAAAQAVEHYEIARYGTLIAWGEVLGMGEAVQLLKESLKEEKNADKLLSSLAEGKLNREAA